MYSIIESLKRTKRKEIAQLYNVTNITKKKYESIPIARGQRNNFDTLLNILLVGYQQEKMGTSQPFTFIA